MFNNYNPYYYYNPVMRQYDPQQFNNNQNQQNQNQQNQVPQQPIYRQPIGLQGKNVDSIDVVKAMDIPLDGSVSYFPLTDGTAIVTKQLQQDGTSKTMIYKPIDVANTQTNYVTVDKLKEELKTVNSKEIKDIKDEIKTLKREFRDYIEDKKED